jgi:hypothetical protein
MIKVAEKSQIHTKINHIANKINCNCTIFWIRRMIKVAEKSQWWQKYFDTEGVLLFVDTTQNAAL